MPKKKTIGLYGRAEGKALSSVAKLAEHIPPAALHSVESAGMFLPASLKQESEPVDLSPAGSRAHGTIHGCNDATRTAAEAADYSSDRHQPRSSNLGTHLHQV